MNKTIEIQVKEKIAKNMSPEIVYVCGNSDYTVKFAFDEDWVEEAKTARFSYDNGLYLDVPFNGDECAFPKIISANFVNVGVYAGDLRTSTDAYVSARKGTLSKNGVPAAPANDVYAQIMELINAGKIKGEAILYFDGGAGDETYPDYLVGRMDLFNMSPRKGDLVIDKAGCLHIVTNVYVEAGACNLKYLTTLRGVQGVKGDGGASILYVSMAWGSASINSCRSEDFLPHTPKVGDLAVTADGMLVEVVAYDGAVTWSLNYKTRLRGYDGAPYTLTSTDKNDIVNAVISQIPYYDGAITVIEDDTQ